MRNQNNSVRVELMQFVRAKGKLVPLFRSDGTVVQDRRGKIKMVREKGLPRGVLVAGMVGGKVRIGWSYVNQKLDRFDKQRGIQIATNRMISTLRSDRVPHKVKKDLKNSFISRCEQYFDSHDICSPD